MTKTIYLAGPIDQGQAREMRTAARAALFERGRALFDPSMGWAVPYGAVPSPSLQRANVAVLRQCDGLLVYLDPTVMSVGVTIEIVEAVNFGTPVAIWAKMKPSWALAYLGVPMFDELDDALSELDRWLHV